MSIMAAQGGRTPLLCASSMPSYAIRSLSGTPCYGSLLQTTCAMLLTLTMVISLFALASFGLRKDCAPEGQLGGHNSHEADESHFTQFPDKDVDAGQQVAAVVHERHEPGMTDLPGLGVQQHSLQQACQAPESEHCSYNWHKPAGMSFHSLVATTSLL